MMEDSAAVTKGIFAGVYFYIIQSDDLEAPHAEELSRLLEENGGTEIAKTSTHAADGFALTEVTHIITTTIDFPQYDAAAESLKAVVKPDWVTISLAKKKTANVKSHSPDPKLYYSGLTVCCADLPPGDADAIIGGVLAMGGLYSSSVSRMVTHIVALSTDNDKCRAAISKALKCKIVLPHWFDDCLKLGRRIDEGPYCLPDPEILHKRPEDRIGEVNRDDLGGATTARPHMPPTPSNSPSHRRRHLNVFKGKKIMLSADLDIGSHLLGTIEDLISSGGGSVTGSVHKADIFICQYRESLEYRIASRAGKDVGSLAWLYYLISNNAWTSPMKRLLHYPISRHGLPGFKNFRISLSNYNGEARVYLENLAKAAGGEFTKTMKEDNTHLITAHQSSEKCDAAKEWNINMVNHLWLEESYAKWQIQTVSNNRYTHFPKRTNLGEVVGMTPIEKQSVERFFFPPGSDIDKSTTEVARPMAIKDPNVAPPKPLVPNKTQEVSFRSSAGVTPKASKENRRHTDGNAYQTPAAARSMDKENETPSTTGSRSAKDKAVAKLHDLAPDIALFQKESKRVGGVIHGGRKSVQDRVPNHANRKRSMSNEDDTDTGADEEAKQVKKAKKAKAMGPPVMRLALSGYKRWVDNARKEGEERAKLREIGILVVPDVATCTHLASPRLVRTEKFICALAHAPIVLSTKFVDDCLQANQRLEPKQYLLEDAEGENRIGYKLSEMLERAKINKGRMLQGFSIYCTEAIHGGFETYRKIVEVNGGKCMLYRGRAGTGAAARAHREESEEDADVDGTSVYLMSGTTKEEAKLWPRFRQMVEAMGKTPIIVRNDWMLNLALSQEVHWKEIYALTEKDVEVDA